jgi:hypothetical protein
VRPFVLHVRPAAESKRQLTVFDSTTDAEYREALYAMAVQAGVTVPSAAVLSAKNATSHVCAWRQ